MKDAVVVVFILVDFVVVDFVFVALDGVRVHLIHPIILDFAAAATQIVFIVIVIHVDAFMRNDLWYVCVCVDCGQA